MADIKTLLGDAYKDGMTVDEINEALKDINFVDPATLPKTVEKTLFDKKVSELATIKKELDELKANNMTDDEKTRAAIQAAEDKEKEFQAKLNKLDVEKLFVEAGLKQEDYKDLIDDIISEDTEKTTKLANNLLTMIKNQKSATEQAVRAEVQRNTPRTPSGKGNDSTTDYATQISEAYARGDVAGAAALIREQQESQINNKGD